MTIELAASLSAHYMEQAQHMSTSLLLNEITLMPQEELNFPVPDHPKIQAIAEILAEHPDDNRTIAQWASHIALSERSLARLLLERNGANFWPMAQAITAYESIA